jgi:hypothetical protein
MVAQDLVPPDEQKVRDCLAGMMHLVVECPLALSAGREAHALEASD